MAVARKRRKSGQHVTSDGYSYLTKRLLLSKAKSAGRNAASQAMNVMGYVITVKDGWVVKQYPNGINEQLQKI
jgi:hypothetical protein